MTPLEIPEAAAGARILVVDDDPHFCRLMTSILERQGFVSESLSDGAPAVERRFVEPPLAMIVMNGQMPHVSGPEAIRRIREREQREGLPRMPILLESSWPSPEIETRAAECGADGWIRTPFTFDEFIAAVLRVGWGSNATADRHEADAPETRPVVAETREPRPVEATVVAELIAQLRAAEERGDMLAHRLVDVLHDANHLFSAVKGYAGLALAELGAPRAADSIAGIDTAAERGARLVSDGLNVLALRGQSANGSELALVAERLGGGTARTSSAGTLDDPLPGAPETREPQLVDAAIVAELAAQLRAAERRGDVLALRLGEVAHDTHNLFEAISGYAELALQDLGNADAARDVAEIRSAAEHGLRLAGDLIASCDANSADRADLALELDGLGPDLARASSGRLARVLIHQRPVLVGLSPTDIDALARALLSDAMTRVPGGPMALDLRRSAANRREAHARLAVRAARVGLGQATRARLPLKECSSYGPIAKMVRPKGGLIEVRGDDDAVEVVCWLPCLDDK